MDPQYENEYHDLEATHWWFVARRQIVRKFVSVEQPRSILDIGCSSGQLLQELTDDGFSKENLTGVDVSDTAIRQCRLRGFERTAVMDGSALAFPDSSVDLIVASDCLEHIENDQKALREWKRVLSDNGVAIVFVPAFMSLWSGHDEVNHHCRRYERGELAAKINNAGLVLKREGYWNATLFPAIAIVRKLQKFLPRNSQNNKISQTNSFINSVLKNILRLENSLLDYIDFPTGISTFCLAQKLGDTSGERK